MQTESSDMRTRCFHRVLRYLAFAIIIFSLTAVPISFWILLIRTPPVSNHTTCPLPPACNCSSLSASTPSLTLPPINDQNEIRSNDSFHRSNFIFRLADQGQNHAKEVFKGAEEKAHRYSIVQRGSYWVLFNFIQPKIWVEFPSNEYMTFATIGDYRYLLANLGEIVQRWRGPISLTLYAPGTDLEITVQTLWWILHCDEPLLKEFLTVSIFFDSNPAHIPSSIPDRSTTVNFDCSARVEVRRILSSRLNYRENNNLTFPVNVARNLAREMARTEWVLSADIELYPSQGLPEKFFRMRQRIANDPNYSVKLVPNQVFVLPVFELAGNVPEIPKSKAELVGLIKKDLAFSFHQNICNECHRIPFYENWVSSTGYNENELRLLATTLRQGQFQDWEPIFIGSKWDDPAYDERLSWDGRRDKFTQAYIMCIKGFEFLIVDNAFLVHRPGIKELKSDSKGNLEEEPAVNEQKELIKNVILPEIKKFYGEKDGCVISL